MYLKPPKSTSQYFFKYTLSLKMDSYLYYGEKYDRVEFYVFDVCIPICIYHAHADMHIQQIMAVIRPG
jgi:hypothetical protein